MSNAPAKSGGVRRAVIALAIVIFAIASLPRLRLAFEPAAAYSELTVMLQLPESAAGDAADTTRTWVTPIESALRASGDVVAVHSQIDVDSAEVRARFRRGIDSELKAARLSSELVPLRARLPRNASLQIWPSQSSSDAAAVFAVTAGNSAEIADELRAVPGVRDVQIFGARRDEVDVRLKTTSDPASVAAKIVSGVAPRGIGIAHQSSRVMPVISAPSARHASDVRIGGVPLEAIAEVHERQAAPFSVARLNGRNAVLLWVYRDDEVPLFAFDHDVHARLSHAGVEEVWSDAAELRAILIRLAIGAAVAMIVLAYFGGFGAALYVPLAIAIAINVWRVTSIRVDVQTLLATAVAIAAMSPLALRKRGGTVFAVFALLLPVAAIFSSAALAPILALPAQDFAIAGISAVVGQAILPVRTGRIARPTILRRSGSVVLACLAATILLLAWFGANLDPRAATASTDRDEVTVNVTLPSGATLAQTVTAAASVEKTIRAAEGARRYWSSVREGRATITIKLQPSVDRPRFEVALRTALPAYAAIDSRSGRASPLADDLDEKPFADDNGAVYRFLLKGNDASALRAAAETIAVRVVKLYIPRGSITPEWPEASTRVALVPRVGVPPAVAAAAATQLLQRTLPPQELHLPDGRTLRVAAIDAPRTRDEVPRRADVLAQPLTIDGKPLAIEHAFDVRTSAISGALTRDLGRFVLPVAISIRAPRREEALKKRLDVDRTISTTLLPPGVAVDRPTLENLTVSREKLRLLGVAALLPLLLFTTAAIVLSSLGRALLALAPAVTGIAVVAPVLAAAGAEVDELTLLATGGAICGVVALAVSTILDSRGVPGAYRTARRDTLNAIGAAVAGVALLAIAASARSSMGEGWRAPLIAAAAVIAAGVPAAVLLPTAIISLIAHRGAGVSAARWASRGGEARAPQILSVRNVTKIYATGFRALSRVTFDLTPGVIGLLGPNGAGKTTLLRILTGLLHPTRGIVQFDGVPIDRSNVAAFRRSIGFLPQEFNAYAGLTAAQFLDYWALERGIDDAAERREQIERLLVLVDLEAHAGRRVRDFSGGMRQRIGIARALLGDPPLLVVDEPTTGLDIDARRRFRELMTTLSRERIVILSTHIASDVEATAGRILLLTRGTLRWDGTPDALIARARGRVFECVVPDAEARVIAQKYRVTTRLRTPQGIRLRAVITADDTLPFDAVKPTLEEAYLSEVAAGERVRGGSFAFLFD
jgi:ABC-2 type transport system ATP-binding protein